MQITKFVMEETRLPKYTPTQEDLTRLDNNFTYHAPISDQATRYETVRATAKELALSILMNCPPSRERSVSLTELETAVFWANASIARNETE
jgi:hypothetical protein